MKSGWSKPSLKDNNEAPGPNPTGHPRARANELAQTEGEEKGKASGVMEDTGGCPMPHRG